MEKGDTPTYGHLSSFTLKYQDVPTLESSPSYTKILLRFNHSIKVDILKTVEDRLSRINVSPQSTSTSFKDKLVFLYVPRSQCNGEDFPKRFTEAFNGVCKVSFGSDLVPVKVVIFGLTRIANSDAVQDFCSLLGTPKSVKVENHKDTSLSGDRVVASFNCYPPKVYEIFHENNSISVGPHKITVRMNKKVHCNTCGLIGHGTNACWTKDKKVASKWVASFNSGRFAYSTNHQAASPDTNEEVEAAVPSADSHNRDISSAPAGSAEASVSTEIVESNDSVNSSNSHVTPSKAPASSNVTLVSTQNVAEKKTVKPGPSSRRASGETNEKKLRTSTVGGAKPLPVPNTTPEGVKTLFNDPSPSASGIKRKKESAPSTNTSNKSSSAKKQRSHK